MKKFCFLLLIATLLFSCKQGGQQNKKNDDKPVITVTIEPLRYFTEAIAGDEFTVVSMVPKGSSPETYDPTPQQLVDLAQSKAYFRIGYIGFEQTWTEKLTDNAPHLQFFDMSENVELILDDTHAHHHKDGHVHEGHTHAGGVEPHIWNSTINAQIIAGNILNALCAIDKANENAYMERYNALIRRIEHTDSLICQMLSSPNADRAFMIYHPALSYFARDYNLHQIPIEAGGKEPSPTHLKNLINSCKNIRQTGWFIGRFDQAVGNVRFSKAIRKALPELQAMYQEYSSKTPYGVPHDRGNRSSGSWEPQHLGYNYCYLHAAYPDLFTPDYIFNAVQYLLGMHPGRNQAAFVTGVGAETMKAAYGVNRADWSYIPGGVSPGTNLIRPDLPELLHFPFLWQEGEYCLGGHATWFMYMVLASNKILNCNE